MDKERNIGPGDDDYGRRSVPGAIDKLTADLSRYQCHCTECGDMFTSDNKRAVTCPACTKVPFHESDPYNAGPCPVCGKVAVGAERRPDGYVNCISNHKWKRGAAAAMLHRGLDPALPGSERTTGTFDFGYRIIFDRGPAGAPTLMRVLGAGGDLLMSAKLAQWPSDIEMSDLVKGIHSAANNGIKSLASRLANPTASAIIDSLWKH